jgi:hypothetical protein
MGFSKSSTKLGQVSEEKTVREAVVAIPFLEIRGEKQFFNIEQCDIEEAIKTLKEKGSLAACNASKELQERQSIIDMVGKMSRYVFPPRFDFITNKTVKPIAMYIFEFEHTFTKQDLIDMWQNLSPTIGRRFKTKSAIISHELLENELMSGEVEDSLRWMVFKVKQKAADNYFDMLADSAQEGGFKFELERGITKDKSEFNYSYNWPYDFFSLIELIKVDSKVTFE